MLTTAIALTVRSSNLPRCFQFPVGLDRVPGFRALVINSMKPEMAWGKLRRGQRSPSGPLGIVRVGGGQGSRRERREFLHDRVGCAAGADPAVSTHCSEPCRSAAEGDAVTLSQEPPRGHSGPDHAALVHRFRLPKAMTVRGPGCSPRLACSRCSVMQGSSGCQAELLTEGLPSCGCDPLTAFPQKTTS